MNETDYLRTTSCHEWIPTQNPSFHVSMILVASAFLVPHTCQYYVVALRGLLVAGLTVLMLWGSAYWCTRDVLVWGIIFLIQNLSQFAYSLYHMRRVKFPSELEDLYQELFEPFNISREQFRALTNYNCKWVNIFPGDKYAVEGHTTTEARVSLLVSGCLRVTYEGIYLHDIKERQLIDSIEWESTKPRRGELFQVSVEAIDRCSYLCWNREKLQYYLDAIPELKSAFNFIRGKDIVEKVQQTAINASIRSNKSQSEQGVCTTRIRRGMAEEDPDLMCE